MAEHDCRGAGQTQRIAAAIAEVSDGDTLIVGSGHATELALALLTEQMPALENVHVVVRTVDGTTTPDVAERHGDGPRVEFGTAKGSVIIEGRKVTVIPHKTPLRDSPYFYTLLEVLTAARGMRPGDQHPQPQVNDLRLAAAQDARMRAVSVGGGVYEIDLDQ